MSAAQHILPNAVAFTVPIPTTTNHLYATVNGRRVLSEKGRQYKEQAGWIALLAARRSGLRITPETRFRLTLRFHFPNNRRDLSNAVKVLEDSIAEALAFNDVRIDELHLYRADVDKQNPRCDVRLEAL